MPDRILLVDFENVPRVDLGALPEDVTVPFFFGASQRSVSKDFLKAALKLGSRFMPIDIEGQGKNALDFHIAYYLGEFLAQNPTADCVILSRDKGFDPLVRHLVGRGFRVRRAAALADAFPNVASAALTPHPRPPRLRSSKADAPRPQQISATPELVAQARASLAALPPRNRPRKRQGLVKHLISGLGRRHSESVIQALVDELLREGVLQETGGQMSYRL
ncbi:MAG: PIN domain-containing protein [Steroidobacteraceae bacterium]|nr:PIN domain-containing protein [Steroidobacteraceae bacterium]MDW8260074.1 PIN domain-containing protein [Gammaproteobacteria bacterium]